MQWNEIRDMQAMLPKQHLTQAATQNCMYLAGGEDMLLMSEWVCKRANELVSGQEGGLVSEWANKLKTELRNEGTNEVANEQTYDWVNKWTTEWMTVNMVHQPNASMHLLRRLLEIMFQASSPQCNLVSHSEASHMRSASGRAC